MSRRKWRDSGLEDLGISASVLRDLDTVQTAREDIENVNAAIERASNITSIGAEIRKAELDLDASVGRASLADFRSADASIRAADALVRKSAIKTLDDRIADTKAIFDQASADLGKGAISAIADVRVPHPLKELGFAAAARADSLFSALPKPSQIPTWESPIKSTPFESRLSAMSVSPLFEIRNEATYRMTKTVAEAMTRPVAEAMREWSAARTLLNNRVMFDMARSIDMFETSIGDAVRRSMMPIFDGLGRSIWRGIAETLEQIDWETVVESWRVQEARRPRTKTGFAALEAYDALNMGHFWVADRFLVDYLGVEVNDDTREALWIVLREAFERTVTSPATWIVHDDEQATRYLRGAIYKVAKRVRRDKERPDRVWWPEGEKEKDKEGRKLSKPALSSNTLDFIVRKSPGPEELLIPPQDDMGRVLEMLYLEGSRQDKKIVEMLIAGFDLPAIAEIVGWPEVQRFLRKARRWITIKL